MKPFKVIGFLALILIGWPSSAQNVFRAVVRDSLTGENLPGVNVMLDKTGIGAATGPDGQVELRNIPDGKQVILFSAIGYQKRSIPFNFPVTEGFIFEIFLTQAVSELDEVVVMTTRTNSRIEEVPLKIEVLAQADMDEENSYKPGNVASILGDISSVQVQQVSAINGGSVIRMQGLDGKYTLLLRDGMPAYGGLSGGLDILQIPPLDLKQIEIIKGPASTLNGGGAIAGLINFVSREPSDSAEAAFSINQSTLTETNLDTYLSGTSKGIGYTLFSGYNTQQAVDVDKDGFSDVPGLHTIILHPQFFYHWKNQDKLKIGLYTSYEDRTGGDMTVLQSGPESDHQYQLNSRSVRNAAELQYQHNFSTASLLSFKSSLNRFGLNESSNLASYSGNQWNGYSELYFTMTRKDHQLIAGANYLLDSYRKLQGDSLGISGFTDHTTGLFVQYSYQKEKKISLEAGIRGDYHSQYGWFILPSIAVLLHATKELSFRVNAGSGYKTPNIIEYIDVSNPGAAYGIASADDLKAERSFGGTVEWNYHKIFENDLSLFINQSFFLTDIINPVVVNLSDSRRFSLMNLEGRMDSKGIDTYVTINYSSLELYMGYTFTVPEEVTSNDRSYLLYTPLHRAATAAALEIGDHWMTGIEASYNGYQYRSDGTRTSDYFFLAAAVQYNIGPFTFVLNGENLLDFRQNKIEQVILPPISHPGFATIWAPLDGRVINLSVLVKL
ncbi:MAG: TonB-dependent receptor [Bacteroidota bacterium]